MGFGEIKTHSSQGYEVQESDTSERGLPTNASNKPANGRNKPTAPTTRDRSGYWKVTKDYTARDSTPTAG